MDAKLTKFRTQIDTIDQNLLKLLAERFRLTQTIGMYKKEKNISVVDPDRFGNMLKSRKISAEKLDLPAGISEEFFALIHDFSVQQQTSD